MNNAAIGYAGLVALAPALRRRPALETLGLVGNSFGDEGLAALLAPPPPAGAPSPPTGGLTKLMRLYLSRTQISDAGRAPPSPLRSTAALYQHSRPSICMKALLATHRKLPSKRHWGA